MKIQCLKKYVFVLLVLLICAVGQARHKVRMFQDNRNFFARFEMEEQLEVPGFKSKSDFETQIVVFK